MSERERPPFVADERTQLMGWYRLQREIVQAKCEGLSDEQAYQVVIPTSPLMTVAGLVSHLRWVEHTWFEVAFAGTGPEGSPAFRETPEDADFRVEGRPLSELLREYRRQCDRSDQVIAGASLDDTGAFEGFPAAGASLRWMIIHMIEETARHAGHLDLIRELIDGHKSYF